MNALRNCILVWLVLFVPELFGTPTNAWIATWATSPQSGTPNPREPLLNIDNQTVRERVRVSHRWNSDTASLFERVRVIPSFNRLSHCGGTDRWDDR